MSLPFEVLTPFTIITGTDGKPIDNGRVYIGTENLNPETNPVVVYWDVDLTQPASQPLHTLAGYIVRAGTPGRLYCATDYSMTVRDRVGELVFYAASSAVPTEPVEPVVENDYKAGGRTTSNDSSVGAAAGSVARTFLDKARDTVSVYDFGVIGDNIVDDTISLQAAIDYCDATRKILNFEQAKMKISSGITAIGSFGGIITNSPFAGLYPVGSGYTAITIGIDSAINPGLGVDGTASFRIQNLDLAVFGTGNAVDGILLNFISLSVVKRLRAYNLSGFGIKMDWANNSTFEHISTELCGTADVFAIQLTGGFLANQINQNTFSRVECESSKGCSFAIDALAYNNFFGGIHIERIALSGSTQPYQAIFGGATSVFNDIRLQSFDAGVKAKFITANSVFNVVRVEIPECDFETWGNPGTHREMHTQVNVLRCEPFLGDTAPLITVKTDSEHGVNFNDCSIARFSSSNGIQELTRCTINRLDVLYMNADNLKLHDCIVHTLVSAPPTALPNFITAIRTTFKAIVTLPSYSVFKDCYITNIGGSIRQYVAEHPLDPSIYTNANYTINVDDREIDAVGTVFDCNVLSNVGTLVVSKCVFIGRVTELATDHSSLFDDDNQIYETIVNFDTYPVPATHLVPRIGMRHCNMPPTTGQPKAWICTVSFPDNWESEGNL